MDIDTTTKYLILDPQPIFPIFQHNCILLSYPSQEFTHTPPLVHIVQASGLARQSTAPNVISTTNDPFPAYLCIISITCNLCQA